MHKLWHLEVATGKRAVCVQWYFFFYLFEKLAMWQFEGQIFYGQATVKPLLLIECPD